LKAATELSEEENITLDWMPHLDQAVMVNVLEKQQTHASVAIVTAHHACRLALKTVVTELLGL